jgi:hypothetical protein
MDVYKYISENPQSSQKAIDLCLKKGYEPTSDEHLADCLSDYVSSNGNTGLMELMKIHPDKEILVNYYSRPVSESERRIDRVVSYTNASGDANTNTVAPTNDHTALTTNIIIITAAILIGFAIISKN